MYSNSAQQEVCLPLSEVLEDVTFVCKFQFYYKTRSFRLRKIIMHLNPKCAIHIRSAKSLWLLVWTLLFQCNVNLWDPTFASLCTSSFRKQIMAIKVYPFFNFKWFDSRHFLEIVFQNWHLFWRLKCQRKVKINRDIAEVINLFSLGFMWNMVRESTVF